MGFENIEKNKVKVAFGMCNDRDVGGERARTTWCVVGW